MKILKNEELALVSGAGTTLVITQNVLDSLSPSCLEGLQKTVNAYNANLSDDEKDAILDAMCSAADMELIVEDQLNSALSSISW